MRVLTQSVALRPLLHPRQRPVSARSVGGAHSSSRTVATVPAPQPALGSGRARSELARRSVIAAAAGRDEPEVAVFRFTLGIPGFDDALLPRVVGIAGSVLLYLNHTSTALHTDAEVRTEILGVLVAIVCVLLPSIGRGFEQGALGGDYSAPAAEAPEVFGLCDQLHRSSQEELAWATIALLRTTGSSGCLIRHSGRAVCARGFWKPGAAADGTPLKGSALLEAFDAKADTLIRGPAPEVLPIEKGSSMDNGIFNSPLMPRAARSMIRVTSGQTEVLLYSCTPTALQQRRRQQWVLGVAQKVQGVLHTDSSPRGGGGKHITGEHANKT